MACSGTCERVEWEITDIEEPRRITSPSRCDLPHPDFDTIAASIKRFHTPETTISECGHDDPTAIHPARRCFCNLKGEREEVMKEKIYRGIDIVARNADNSVTCTRTYWYSAVLIKYRTKGECVSTDFAIVRD